MKKLLLLATFAVATMFSLSGNAQVQWQPIDKVGATELQGNTKMFFIDFSTSWCGWCKKMDRDTYTNKLIAAVLNHYYLSVHFDAESKDAFKWNGQEFAGSTKRNTPHSFTTAILGGQIGYPSVAIFDQQMKLVQMLSGYQGPEDFIKFICFFVNDNYKKYNVQNFMEVFDSQILPEIKKEIEFED